MKRQQNDEKGLKRLVLLAITGSALIIIVYALYFYSQAHKHVATNLIDQKQKDLQIASSIFQRIDSANVIYSPVVAMVFRRAVRQWPIHQLANNYQDHWLGRPDYYHIFKSGRIADGTMDSIQRLLRLKFQAMPPLEFLPKDHDFIVQAVHVQHFELPYHVMMNWDNKYLEDFPFRRYQRVFTDSIQKEFLLLPENKGFSIQRKSLNDELILFRVSNSSDLQTLAAHYKEAMSYYEEAQFKSIYLKFPILDFSLNYSYNDLLDKKLIHQQDTAQITRANAQIKLLVGPDLRLNPSYSIEVKEEEQVGFAPPFLIILKRINSNQPYFMAYVTNNDLLLK